ncbi:MAG: peptidylprolyl isomerase [Bacteroidetes bacterium]|nr:MAG: peptidylprolyl isomerase [Bacteroidota bacterium]
MGKKQFIAWAGSWIRSHLFRVCISLIQVPILSAQTFPDSTHLQLQAPVLFQATFETTKGTFVVEAIREWSPSGVDRFYQLLQTHFYDSNCLFRVQKGYVVQFGISNTPEVNQFWEHHPIEDEPVRHSNLRGVISYARDGPDTRTVQLFINLDDNYKLDTIDYNGLRGFPPIGRLISGFGVVEALNGTFGFEPANHQDSLMKYGNSYMDEYFPGLDYIVTAKILKEKNP